jgi:hypothetical protein
VEQQKTRVVRLRTGNLRQQAQNSRTMALQLPVGGIRAPLPSYEDLFLANYARIREVCEGFRRKGLAIIAIDSGGVSATACVAAKRGGINSAIVGRHGMCDIFLESDPALSLRHLAVLIHPLDDHADVRYRVLDLRTSVAFSDERGRKLEALEAEGPLFIRCGEHALFLLTTSDEEVPWPDDAQSGWACVPERVYLDDAPAEPDRWLRRRLKAVWGESDEQRTPRRRRTIVQTIRGPSRARRKLLGENDEVLGQLDVESDDGRTAMVVGKVAAREGVLLGRYERCDNDGLPVLTNGRISRVHLLLVEVAGALYAIDTASSNGMWCGEDEARVVLLEHGRSLTLGEGLARLEWRSGIYSGSRSG